LTVSAPVLGAGSCFGNGGTSRVDTLGRRFNFLACAFGSAAFASFRCAAKNPIATSAIAIATAS
jgi:hypothetical protein